MDIAHRVTEKKGESLNGKRTTETLVENKLLAALDALLWKIKQIVFYLKRTSFKVRHATNTLCF